MKPRRARSLPWSWDDYLEVVFHSPKEYSRPEDIANGANVLLHTLLKLDGMTLR